MNKKAHRHPDGSITVDTVLISTVGEPRTCRSFARKGDWAITKDIDRPGYVITHVPSGMCATPVGFKRIKDAKELLGKFPYRIEGLPTTLITDNLRLHIKGKKEWVAFLDACQHLKDILKENRYWIA